MGNKEYLMNYNECGRFIFLEFTKELIRNYSPEEILRIKNVIQERLRLEEELENKKYHVKEFLQPQEKAIQIIQEENPPIIQKKESFQNMMNVSKKEKQFIVKKEDEPFVKKEWFPPISEEKKPLILKRTEEEFSNMERYRKPIEIKQRENPFRELKLIIPETKFPLHIQYIKPVPINKEIDLGKLNPLVNDRFVNEIECYGPNENVMVKGAMGNKRTGIILTDEEIKTIVNKFSEETRIPAHEGVFKVAAGRLLFSAIVSDTVGSKFIISKIPLQEQAETYRSQNSIHS